MRELQDTSFNDPEIKRIVTLINFSDKTVKLKKDVKQHLLEGKILSSNYDRFEVDTLIQLMPYESLIVGF